MKVEVREEREDFIKFRVEGVSPGFMNAIRRMVIAGVPVFAIEDVIVYENTSPIFDEYIAHRLGLIPLKAKYGTYNEESEVRFTLDKKGPGSVYSGDLEGGEGVEVADDRIEIVRLGEGQRVRMELVAKVGRGEEHAKWQAGNAGYEKKGEGVYEVFIESYGNMSVRELVKAAVEEVRRRVERWEKGVKK